MKTVTRRQVYFGKIRVGMTPQGSQDISELLVAWGNGDTQALSELVSVLYPELRRIARQHLRKRPPGHTMESAALANEAYMKLVRSRGIRCNNRAHFFALCAQVIRRILVDHARNCRYVKRAGDAVRVPLDGVLLGMKCVEVDLLALDQALESLSKIDERKVRVVELRFFGGLNAGETAEVLQISEETVLRDWRMAKSWLFRALSKPVDFPQRDEA